MNDVPKLHTKNSTVKDHSISFHDEPDLLIPFHLSGIISYFCTRISEKKELFDCKNLFLTPDASDWNPHFTSVESSEKSMLNFKCKISEKGRWFRDPQIFDGTEELPILSSVTVDQWNDHIDSNISSAYIVDNADIMKNDFASAINLRGVLSSFSASIGSTVNGESSDLFYFDIQMISDWHNFEVSLRSKLNPTQISFVKIKAVEVARSRGVSLCWLKYGWSMNTWQKEPSTTTPNSVDIMPRIFRDCVLPMIGCSGTKDSRVRFILIPCLPQSINQ